MKKIQLLFCLLLIPIIVSAPDVWQAKYVEIEQSIKAVSYTHLCMDRFDDKLWLGCKGEGVFVLRKTLENILPELDVYSFECDSLERLWVATIDDCLKVIQKRCV